MASCVFCEVLAAAATAADGASDDAAVAPSSTTGPVFKGHVLVVPDGTSRRWPIFRWPPSAPSSSGCSGSQSRCKPGMEADGSFVAMNNVVSQSVPHLHVHVVPRRRKDGLRGFFWPRVRYESAAEMADVRGAHPGRPHVTIRMGKPEPVELHRPVDTCSPRAKRSADQSTA